MEKKYIYVAINGMGRIGRLIFRNILVHPRIIIVAINDIMDPDNLQYLLENDTAHGEMLWPIQYKNKKLTIGTHIVKTFQEKKINRLPWAKFQIDLVIDTSGTIKTKADADNHIEAGAKRVIVTNTINDAKTIIYGLNHDQLSLNDQVISASSCTTNALALTLKIIEKHDKIIRGFFNTIHAPTNDQKVLDNYHESDWRRGRSVLNNIIPTTTNAEEGIIKLFPHLKNKLNGSSLRVPILTGSLIDLVLKTNSEWNLPTIKSWFEKEKLNDYFHYSQTLMVSSDVVGSKFGAVIDNNLIKVNHDLIKIGIWYDNEASYVHQISRTINHWAKLILKNKP